MRGLVLFDFGGTLDADGSRWSVRFHAAYQAAGGKQSFAAFDRAFRFTDTWLDRNGKWQCVASQAMLVSQK